MTMEIDPESPCGVGCECKSHPRSNRKWVGYGCVCYGHLHGFRTGQPVTPHDGGA